MNHFKYVFKFHRILINVRSGMHNGIISYFDVLNTKMWNSITRTYFFQKNIFLYFDNNLGIRKKLYSVDKSI